tara:strand:- start:2527 stop:2889 length:363 start_codon:yes stop_codon:yes gene_type:complete
LSFSTQEIPVKKQLKDALLRFKKEAFKMSHQAAVPLPEVPDEILALTSEALENQYRLHFDDSKDANPHRIETFQLIKSVTLETILPPVVEKLMRRITALEHTNESMINLLDELMEALSEE